MVFVRPSLQNLLKYISQHHISWISLRIHQSLKPGHHLPAVYKKSYFYIQLASKCDLPKCNEKKKCRYPFISVPFHAVETLSDMVATSQMWCQIKMYAKYKNPQKTLSTKKVYNISIIFATISLLLHTHF